MNRAAGTFLRRRKHDFDWREDDPRVDGWGAAFFWEEFYWLVGVMHRGFTDGLREVRNTFGSNISFRTDVFEILNGFDIEIGG